MKPITFTQYISLAALLSVSGFSAMAQAATAQALLSGYSATGNAARGQQLFTTRQGREWSCSSCHGTPPTQTSKHASTGKPIAPLAPAFNVERFTDSAKVEKWFRRNCNDVLGRPCSDTEKADVITWLLTLKP